MKFLKQLHFVSLLLTALLAANASMAQCDLKRYQELIKEGDSYLTREEPDYKQAMNAYSAAMTACKDKMPEVQKKIFYLFDKINQLKTKAEIAEKSAQAERAKTDSALIVAENEKRKAEAEKQVALNAMAKTDSALTIANRIVDRMFFYQDKFALAVDNKYGVSNSFGFIDRQGNTVIDFKFTAAMPFNPLTGFAQVELRGSDKFLLDTTGRTFELCVDTNHLVYKFNNEVLLRFSGEAVDFSGQKLTSVPIELFNSPQIKILILSNNLMTELPDQMDVFKDSLTFLSLRENKISNLPHAIGKLKALVKLDLASNQLVELPPDIGNLSNLEQLILDDNPHLLKLPVELGMLKNLKSLQINTTRLTMLPREIGNCKALEDLSLAFDIEDIEDPGSYIIGLKFTWREKKNPDFTELPIEIGNLTNLKKLNISTSGLRSLPNTTGDLVNLKSLILRCNMLENIPPEIGRLTNLETLDLFQNNISALPGEIAGLTNLNTLLIDYNRLTVFPTELTGLRNLKFLDMERNKLSVIPPEIAGMQKLSNLNLSGNELSSLPSALGELKNLKELNLSENMLTSLPSELGELKNLNQLNLARNSLTTIPDEVGNLDNLETLYLQNNNLTSLPKNIGKLVKLSLLPLYSNKLQSLPDEIGNFVKLESLLLQYNQLTSISPLIGQLKNLMKLNVSHNLLTSLPNEIGQLSKLKELYLDSNNLTSLPSEIGNLKKLEKLDLRYNDISETEKLKIKELLPKTKIVWSDNETTDPSTVDILTPYLDAVQNFKALREQNPGQYAAPLAQALFTLASVQRLKYTSDDVKSAESNYSEALTLYRELAKTNPDLYMPMVAATLDSISEVKLWYGNPSADSTCLEALALNRSLAKSNPGKYSASVAFSLRNLSRAQFKTNRMSAIKTTREVIEIYEGLVISDSSLKPQLAKCYANLAYYITFDKNFKEAERLVLLALKTDPSFKAVNRYLAPILLFQGKFNKAKSIYLEYKDQEFPKYRYITYKDGFLVDFERFEKAGITHPDVVKILEMLTHQNKQGQDR